MRHQRSKNSSAALATSLLVLFALLLAPRPLAAADYANPHLLTSTAELEQLLETPGLRIIDVRSREKYDAGHIPGALHLGADDVIDPDSHVEGELLPFDRLAAMLAARGIARNSQVVLYDDRGGFHASRLFWMLEYFGHRQVSILNGGFPKWQDEARAVTTDVPPIQPASFAITLMPRKAATADWLLDRQGDPSVVVIDVRPPKAYAAGHIPGALNIPWKQNLAADSTLKSAGELLEHFAALGVTKDKNVAVHCQNGKAAGHSYFTLRLLGFPRVRSYDRSWAEWGPADDLPKAVGKKG